MKKLIIANWKLNPVRLKDAQKLASLISKKSKNKVVLCPPAIYLSSVKYSNLGAQDCFWQEKGAYTGQTSPLQLKDLKVKYCLVGHSERRGLGETDEMVNAKLKTLLSHGIIPVLCVGYGTSVEQDDLEVTDILKSQLTLGLLGIEISKIIVAYEPFWAIGTGKVATPEHADKISLFIKTKFKVVSVLYGGSVNSMNAQSYLQQQQIDGLLIGGDSLIPAHFNTIINL